MIALIVIAAILLGFLIYWFFWQPLVGPTETLTPTSTTGQLTPSGTAGERATTTTATTTGGLTAAEKLQQQITANPSTGVSTVTRASQVVVSSTALYATAISSGIVYYNAGDGKFYKLDANGNSVALSNETFNSVSNAVIDPTGSRAILEYPNGTKIMYDFTTGKQVTLPSHWEDFSFSATGEQITFKNMALDTENRYLVTANYDGSGAKIIEAIGDNADKVATNWSPSNQVVATYTETTGASRSEVYFIGQNNENFKSMTVEGQGFEGIWSPSGSTMLYSVYTAENNYKPELWVSSASGDSAGANRTKINLETWAENCSYAGESIAICSVPQTLSTGAGLAKDATTAGVQDDIYAINLTTGQAAYVTTPTSVTNIGSVMVNAGDSNNIYYTDSSTGKIYKVNLN